MKDFLHNRTIQRIAFITIAIVIVWMGLRIYQGIPFTPALHLQPIEIPEESPTSQYSFPVVVVDIPITTPSVRTQIETEAPLEIKLVPLFDIDEELFIHPAGNFQLYPPAGWLVGENEAQKWVRFSSPDKNAYLEVQATFTGQSLDQDSFARFIAAMEEFKFGEFFIVDEKRIDLGTMPNTNILVVALSKHLEIDQEEYTVISFYLQEQEEVFIFDYWMPGFFTDVSEGEYKDFVEKINIQRIDLSIPEQFSSFDMISYTSDDYLVDIPLGWAHTSQKNDTSIIDTFLSPDLHAALHILFYEDAEPLSNNEAYAFTRTLLREFVTDEIMVTENFLIANGGRQINWYSISDQGQYQGITQMLNLDHKLVITFYLMDESHQDLYADIFSLTLENIEIITNN